MRHSSNESCYTYESDSVSYGASIATVPIGYAGGKILEAIGGKIIRQYQNLEIRRSFNAVKKIFPIPRFGSRPDNIMTLVDDLLEFAGDVYPSYPADIKRTAQMLLLQQIRADANGHGPYANGLLMGFNDNSWQAGVIATSCCAPEEILKIFSWFSLKRLTTSNLYPTYIKKVARHLSYWAVMGNDVASPYMSAKEHMSMSPVVLDVHCAEPIRPIYQHQHLIRWYFHHLILVGSKATFEHQAAEFLEKVQLIVSHVLEENPETNIMELIPSDILDFISFKTAKGVKWLIQLGYPVSDESCSITIHSISRQSSTTAVEEPSSPSSPYGSEHDLPEVDSFHHDSTFGPDDFDDLILSIFGTQQLELAMQCNRISSETIVPPPRVPDLKLRRRPCLLRRDAEGSARQTIALI